MNMNARNYRELYSIFLSNLKKNKVSLSIVELFERREIFLSFCKWIQNYI